MKKEPFFTTSGIWLKDRDGRTVMPRGCNLGAGGKVPVIPRGETWIKESLSLGVSGSENISFAGTPFPLEECSFHFKQLKKIGFTSVRLGITWEAVEHQGPGIYDEEYLAYLHDLIEKGGEYGISFFIDPHQDVWSRWTGGDGAPAWTMEELGIIPERLGPAGGALTHQFLGKSMEQMSWPLNNLYYGAATMFTLFFAGNVFAPEIYIQGEPVQEFLQGHYIEAMKHTARRLKDLDNIIGFGSMNEPSAGFIGQTSLASYGRISALKGYLPTPFEGMQAVSGYSVKVRKFTQGIGGVKFRGLKELNPEKISIFRDGFECPWKKSGVWEIRENEPVIRRDDYFSQVNGKPVDFKTDFLKPFQERFAIEIRKKHPQYLVFVEGVPSQGRVNWKDCNKEDFPGIVDAFHWYDSLTLITKNWHKNISVDWKTNGIRFYPSAGLKEPAKQIQELAEEIHIENIPCWLGEFGVPFDLKNGKYLKKKDFRANEEALGAYYDGIDRAMIPCSIWNYNFYNTDENGDGWNGENLSIFCKDAGSQVPEQEDLKGLRAVKGYCRPYPLAVAGTPLFCEFNRKKTVFLFKWETDPQISAPTEIFIPEIWFPGGWEIEFEGECAEIEEYPEDQKILIYTKGKGTASVRIFQKKQG